MNKKNVLFIILGTFSIYLLFIGVRTTIDMPISGSSYLVPRWPFENDFEYCAGPLPEDVDRGCPEKEPFISWTIYYNLIIPLFGLLISATIPGNYKLLIPFLCSLCFAAYAYFSL